MDYRCLLIDKEASLEVIGNSLTGGNYIIIISSVLLFPFNILL